MTTSDDLKKAVQTYLNALYNGDVALFRKAFHPEARLFSATEGKLVALSLDQYMDIVRGRPSPASRGDQRQDEIVSLIEASPTTAHARLHNTYLPKRFTDELILIQIDGAWKIISKVWHFELI